MYAHLDVRVRPHSDIVTGHMVGDEVLSPHPWARGLALPFQTMSAVPADPEHEICRFQGRSHALFPTGIKSHFDPLTLVFVGGHLNYDPDSPPPLINDTMVATLNRYGGDWSELAASLSKNSQMEQFNLAYQLASTFDCVSVLTPSHFHAHFSDHQHGSDTLQRGRYFYLGEAAYFKDPFGISQTAFGIAKMKEEGRRQDALVIGDLMKCAEESFDLHSVEVRHRLIPLLGKFSPVGPPVEHFLEWGDIRYRPSFSPAEPLSAYVGFGERTNKEGIAALQALLGNTLRLYPVEIIPGMLHLDCVLNVLSPGNAERPALLLYELGLAEVARELLPYGVNLFERRLNSMPNDEILRTDNEIRGEHSAAIARGLRRAFGTDLGRYDVQVVSGLEQKQLALNFIHAGPRDIVLPRKCPLIERFAEARGISTLVTPLHNLILMGGAVTCVTGIAARSSSEREHRAKKGQSIEALRQTSHRFMFRNNEHQVVLVEGGGRERVISPHDIRLPEAA